MHGVSHIQQGLWVRDDTWFEPWIECVQSLEKGCFDAFVLAEVMGLSDT
jgi:hypothetical protein